MTLMRERATDRREQANYVCPVDVPLRHLGGRWKLILCFYLLHAPRRNGELRRLVPQVPQKTLTQQLRELERDGVVHREVFDQLPPRVVYSIVAGERAALSAVVDALCAWGLRHVAVHGGTIEVTSMPPPAEPEERTPAR